jgi:hypothetical protein
MLRAGSHRKRSPRTSHIHGLMLRCHKRCQVSPAKQEVGISLSLFFRSTGKTKVLYLQGMIYSAPWAKRREVVLSFRRWRERALRSPDHSAQYSDTLQLPIFYYLFSCSVFTLPGVGGLVHGDTWPEPWGTGTGHLTALPEISA